MKLCQPPVARKKKTVLDTSKYTPAQLADYFRRLFQIADGDKNGTLDRQEFAKLLTLSGFTFSPHEIAQLVTFSTVHAAMAGTSRPNPWRSFQII
jgi:Ca2+-binding EF-hand superfamily protein